MKIKTQMTISLGGMLFLLAIVAIGGYLSATIVSRIGNAYPTALLPGVVAYHDIRFKTLEIAVHGYQGEIALAREKAEVLLPRLELFSKMHEDESGPFYQDDLMVRDVPYISNVMRNVIDTTLTLTPNQPVSAEFEAAVNELEAMEDRANSLIDYLIEVTTGRINDAISVIVGALSILGFLALVVATVVGFLVTRKLSRGLTKLTEPFRQISQGDLTVTADDSSRDEFGQLAHYFNNLANNLKSTIGQMAEMVTTLAELSSRFRASGESFQERAQLTSDDTQMVATAMTEMSATIKEVAGNAESTSKQAQEASQQADTARNLVEKSVQSSQSLQNEMSKMSEQVLMLKEKTDSISTVVDVIQGIAEQTNLLALNAAIEAARAGEQGRGFAVVADEVRTLATRTGQSTQEIVDVIQSVQSMAVSSAEQISSGRKNVEDNAEAIQNIESGLMSILDSISLISGMNQQIATSAQEQSHVAEDMNTNVLRISDLSEQNAVQTEEINQDISTIDGLVKDTHKIIQQFQY